MQPRRLGARRFERQGLCPAFGSTRETEPRTVVERALEGENPRRAPTGGPDLAKVRAVAERTPGGSKARKRACRPFTGELSAEEEQDGTCGTLRRVEATGLANAGILRPGS